MTARKPMTTTEAAEYAHIGYRKVLEWIASGELPAINVSGASPGGARYRIDQRELDRCLESRRVAA